MQNGWRYRVGSFVGVAGMTMAAIYISNHPLVQSLFTSVVPLFWRLDPVTLTGREFYSVMGVSTAIVAGSLLPLMKPRPRRILDIILLTQRRIVVAGAVLATTGYFNWSHRLPRATLVMTCGTLLFVLPAWFVLIRRRPNSEYSRTIIVGDDAEAMEAVLAATDKEVLGYVSPLDHSNPGVGRPSRGSLTDGGTTLENDTRRESGLGDLQRLSGLARLDEVLVTYDVDTALLGFSRPDRAEFFGTLDACYEHGVTAKVHRKHADSVLTTGFGSDELVDVDMEPWDTLDHVLKRLFDITFSAVGLVILAPVMLAIGVAIKIDDGGSILYSQPRTATFGGTFTVYKFRSMYEGAESGTGATISREDNGDVDPRVTRVGRFLRQTHLDEIPQMWSILTGQMSVVGPRPERPQLDTEMEQSVGNWRSRWFVKPGLTGLAQVQGTSGHEPEEKLRYDIEYIRRQSFWFDVKIVIRQFWHVIYETYQTLRR